MIENRRTGSRCEQKSNGVRAATIRSSGDNSIQAPLRTDDEAAGSSSAKGHGLMGEA